MQSLGSLERRISEIEKRNKRVERDKEWETSIPRKISLAALTYASVAVSFLFLGVENPLAMALVPTLAFFVSTLTLSFLKNAWNSGK